MAFVLMSGASGVLSERSEHGTDAEERPGAEEERTGHLSLGTVFSTLLSIFYDYFVLITYVTPLFT